MRRYLEVTDTDGNAVLINVDFIQYVTVNEYKETIVGLNDGDYFAVKQKYTEIRELLNNVNR